MEQDFEKDVKEIMSGLICPKGFECYKQEFETLCKARDVGLETYVECLELHPRKCPFSIPFADIFYCN